MGFLGGKNTPSNTHNPQRRQFEAFGQVKSVKIEPGKALTQTERPWR